MTTEYNICNGHLQSRASKYPLEKFVLENLGQGHGVQHSKWFHLMANVNHYKVIIEHYQLALTVFEIVTFQNV